MNNPITGNPKSLLACLLMSLLSTAAQAQTSVELTSITSTTNGVRVAWTNPEPGFAYTVQVRESLTSGAWRNGAMRYRWPWPYTHWADAPRSLPASRYYRLLAQPAATPNRGRLLTSYVKGQFTVSQQNAAIAAWGMAYFATARYGIISRVFFYETVDPYGLSITNSALLILPVGTNGPLPLVSVQHDTRVMRSEAPTQPGSGDKWASVLASYGYAVVAADYLGLGTNSPGYQAYLHAKSEATSVVDALRAGRSLCASNNVTLNGQFFLTGYSQGGHVTMATHRELEAFHTNEFRITASSPCAGPYDLGGVTIGTLLTNANYPSPPLFAMLLAAYLPIYQLGIRWRNSSRRPIEPRCRRCWTEPIPVYNSPSPCPLTRSPSCGPTTRRTSGRMSTIRSVRHSSTTTPIPGRPGRR